MNLRKDCVCKFCVAAYVCICMCACAILYLSSVTKCLLPSALSCCCFSDNVYMNPPYTIINTLHLNTQAHKHTHLMFLYSKCCPCICYCISHTLSSPSNTHTHAAGPAIALMHLSLHMFISPP